MTHTISMEATERLEIGFGRVFEEKAAWMSGEYFPTMGPVFAQHGMRTLARFQVTASNIPDIEPVQGSFSSWPSAEHRRRLQEAPEFVAIRPMRDAALELSDGHLFEPPTDTPTIPDDEDVAVVVANGTVSAGEPLLRVRLAADSASRVYEGKFMSLYRWNDACEALLSGPNDEAAVLRVRILPSAGPQS